MRSRLVFFCDSGCDQQVDQQSSHRIRGLVNPCFLASQAKVGAKSYGG